MGGHQGNCEPACTWSCSSQGHRAEHGRRVHSHKDNLLRADFQKASDIFQHARQLLQVAYGDDDELTLDAFSWCEEFGKIMKEAEDAGWKEWKYVPQAALRKAEEATTINVNLLTKNILGRPK